MCEERHKKYLLKFSTNVMTIVKMIKPFFLSFSSPSYQLNDKRKKQKKNGQKKEAPLADPEPISDISVNAQNTATSPHNGQDSKIVQKISGDGLTTDNEPLSASPHTLTAPCSLPTVTKSLPTNLQPLHGKISTTRRTEKDKKIILYVLAPDQGESSQFILLTIHVSFRDTSNKEETRPKYYLYIIRILKNKSCSIAPVTA